MHRLSLLVALVLLPVSALAAPGDGSDLDRLSETSTIMQDEAQPEPSFPLDEAVPPPPPPDAPPVPLDGGLSLLALAGTGYAARRLRARRA
ncbi:MAG TPA: hypothetical protein VGB53_05410 [Rubricoccaceae bacterium]|jgi:hypothetical protein